MIEHFPGWLNADEATALLNQALGWPLERRKAVIWEKEHELPRLTAFFNDTGEGYEYSRQITPAHKWPPELLGIKERLEFNLKTALQHCLANYYRSGADCVGWHSDSETIFGPNPVIASVSCGATRRFKMKPKWQKFAGDRPAYQETAPQTFDLAHGDLLVFTAEHVLDWVHTIPRTTKPVGARLNLTFRSGK